jgi:hypothetical protein
MSQCTWTSDEPRRSEEMLASQIASHVSGLEVVRVVASASFLKTLALRLPFGTDVKPDFAAQLSARFEARVTVGTPASTATFELRRVGKVAIPETVTLGNGQVWAKTNLRAVGGLTKATSDTDFSDFGGLTRAKKPAYFETPSGGILYNMHVNFGPLCHADFIVPTKVQLQALWDYYYDQPGSDMARDLDVKFDGTVYDSEYQNSGEEWWASGWDAALLYKGVFPGERADTAVHTVNATDNMGLSVRLIRK